MFKLLLIGLTVVVVMNMLLVTLFFLYKFLQVFYRRHYRASYSFYEQKVLAFIQNEEGLDFTRQIKKSDRDILLDVCSEVLRYGDEKSKSKVLKIVWLLKPEKEIYRELKSDVSYIVALTLYRIGKFKLLMDDKTLLEFLNSESIDVRYGAFYAITNIYGKGRIQDLIQYMSRNLEHIDLYGYLLQNVADENVEDVFEMAQSEDDNVACVAVFVLATINEERVFEVLPEIFHRIQSEMLQVILLRSISFFSYIKSEKVVQKVIQVAETENEQIQMFVTLILSKVRSDESVECLKKLAMCSQRSVYIQAIKSLFMLGDISKEALARVKFSGDVNKRSVVINQEKYEKILW
jgi:hypothetical protein